MTHSQPEEGYLAVPESGPGPGVLVLHAWWGLNETVRHFCDRLAAEGYTAYAPDLYGGRVATTVEEAEQLAGGIFNALDSAQAEVSRAARYLGDRADPESPVAVIGFSLGAFFACALSVGEPDRVTAVVLFYGTRPGDYGASRASYLGHFAETDPFEPAESVEGLEQAFRDAGRPVEFHTYAGTGHWFFEPDRTDAYDAQAADLAWERTLAFLRETIGR